MKKKVIICDIDDTIANLDHRLEGVPTHVKNYFDYKEFQNSCVDDEPISWIIDLINTLHDSGAYTIKFVSGRPEYIRDKTLTWMLKYIPWIKNEDVFLMENNGIHDKYFKAARVQGIERNFGEVSFIIDDRRSSIKYLRMIGYKVLDPKDNNF